MLTQKTYITTGERVRTYLLAAFVLSLTVNAMSVLVFPHIPRPKERDVAPTVVNIVRLVMQTPRPTMPPPTPPPRAVNSRPKPNARPRTPRLSVHAASHVVPLQPPAKTIFEPRLAVSGTGTAAKAAVEPMATATETPACATADEQAVVTNVATPEYPESARDLQLGPVSVLVKVTLDGRGDLQDASIQQSSGNSAIDAAAMRAARDSSYAPRIVNCVDVPGAYIFRADFN
jgi:TonB family protein